MKMKFFNNFLDEISFLNKTRLLIAVLIFGMFSICFFIFISLFALKYDHEMLFKNRVMPIEKLEKIRGYYLNDKFLILQSYINRQSKAFETKNKLFHLDRKIENEWKSYQLSTNQQIAGFAKFAHWWLNLFVKYDLQLFDKQAELKIIKSIDENTKNFQEDIEIFMQNNQNDIRNESQIFSGLYRLASLHSELINLHMKEASDEKLRTDKGFFQSVASLFILIVVVFIISSLTTLFIIKKIRELHEYLEVDVKNKTKELQDLNSSLEKRIKQEVEISRKKDNILFQQSKIASLGEMLQNIAHQWRQPLGTLSMIIQSFEIKHKNGKLTDEFIKDRVADAQLLAKNMSETLDDFRTFFNPNKSKKEFSLKDVINKSADLSKYLLDKYDIELHVISFNDVKFYGFKNELTHVLLNFINNAKDALKLKRGKKKIWIMVKFNEKNIIIKVIDNAGGINPKIVSKVFDPYFTTKHQSVGTGIGLYMSKQIIEEHMGGKIYCENIKHKLGESTLFDCAMFVVEIPFLDKQQGGKHE